MSEVRDARRQAGYELTMEAGEARQCLANHTPGMMLGDGAVQRAQRCCQGELADATRRL